MQDGKFSARDYLAACLARIEAVEPQLRAWAHLDSALAEACADEVDAARWAGRDPGILGGVPVGVKDIFNTLDMPTQMGSPIWAGFTPGNDSRVVHYLRMAGAVFPGKTVTAEFAVHTPGPTRNPHNPEYMPGTSSSGSAVAVAAGMVPLALGTQTAGSIVRPASYCGVYGFKPSFGLVPRTGMLKTTDTLDTVGLFARTVDDVALMFEVVRVHGLDYPVLHRELNRPDRRVKGADRPWRVAVVAGPQWDAAEGYARQALDGFAARLGREPGAEVTRVELPDSLRRAHAVHAVIYDRTLAYYFRDEFQKASLVSGVMYEIIARGNVITLDQYKQALQEQTALAREFDHLLGEYDVMLNLATGGEALHGLESPDRPDNCLIWTLCGVPAPGTPGR